MTGQAARTLRPEDEVSHYKVVGPLGAGGMGEVYLAQDRTLGRNVALKILPPNLVRSEERVRRFVLEAKSASSLSHPNIVTIYEIGEGPVRSAGDPDSSPLHFISMELVSGKTLGTLIHEDRTDLRTLLGYLAQAADGIAKAHAAGIVHRDLKPGNIMVTSDGFAKVLDFGLAKLTEKPESDPDLSTGPTMVADTTQEGFVVGTAGYMSPEQVKGKGVDHRSDIFSFGCILYEAATRRRPFAAETAVETMHKILNEKPVPVEEINDKVPAELRRLIRRCLAKSADQRLQSMKDLSLELREIADEYDSLSASASSGSTPAGGMPAARARRLPPAAWAAVALAGVAVIAGAWWVLHRGGPQAQPYETVRVAAQTSRGNVTDCVLSPDGRYLAYLAGEPGHMSARVRQVATGSDVDVLPSADAQIFNPAFSPDGNYLFYTAAQPDNPSYRALYQVPSLGGQPRQRAFDVDTRASFAPDGRQLAFWRHLAVNEANELVVLDLDSGKERKLASITAEESFQGAPQWSPDGRRIATALLRPAPDLQSTIALFDLAGGRRQDFLKMDRVVLQSIAWLNDGSAIVYAGTDIGISITNQVFLTTYPGGRRSRVTNDFNDYSAISASHTDATVAAVRNTSIGNIWIADVTGGPARKLTSITNPENSAFAPATSDTGTVLYDAPDDQFLQVWAMGASGEGARAITSGNAHSINPEGAAGVVVFNRFDKTGMHVWRANTDGSALRQLTTGAGEPLSSLSLDGKLAVVRYFGEPLKVSVISTEDGRVLRTDTDARGVIGPSPDGRSLFIGTAAKDSHDLVTTLWRLVPVAGGPPTATLQLPEQAFEEAWSPAGNSVTFLNRADPAYNLWREPITGGTPQRVTQFKDGRVQAYEWAPDGRRLALRVRSGPDENVWITDADGGHEVKVTSFSSNQVFGMRWMADSRRIVVSAGTSTSDAVLIRGMR